MAEVRFTYLDAVDGFTTEADPTADTTTLLGVTLGASGIDLQGVGKAFNAVDGTAPQDYVTKKQLDDAVISGGTIKEALLVAQQLSSSEGILGASKIVFNNQPVSGDVITISDGVTTRTYGAVSGGDVQYAIGGTPADTLTNFIAAVAGDGAGLAQNSVTSTNFGEIAPTVGILIEDATSGAGLRVYGTWATQADVQFVDFTGESDYTSKVVVNLPTTDPGATNFGLRRVTADLIDGEIHLMLEDNALYSWDATNTQWNLLSGGGSIPDATSAPGGGVKGKVTADEDFGLLITTGILTVKTAATGSINFDGSGDLQVLLDGTTLQSTGSGLSVLGVPANFTVDGVATSANVTAANLNTLTAGSSSDASALHTHSTSFVELTGSGTIAVGDPVHASAANTVAASDNTNANTRRFVGISLTADAGGGTVSVATDGRVNGVLAGATAGQQVYVSTPNGLTTTRPTGAGTHIYVMGRAVNGNDIIMQPQYFGLAAA